MEAVPHRPSQPMLPTDPGNLPKLMVEKFADGTISCLKFIGTIDEGFEGKKLGATATGDTLVLDLGGVKKISSFGIREWVDFVTTANKQVRQMILIECAPKVVDQFNMVANFAGGGRVFSFYAPFRCDYCDSEHRVLLQVDKDHETIKSMKLAERPCLSCKEPMYFDEDGATYFSYLISQEKFELEPEVAGFLASKLNYVVSDLNRKLRVDKVIEGRMTYLRLVGDLDRTFPREKLAEGLEGTVIIDLGAVGRIEPAGAAEWRGFVKMVTPLVEQLYLAAVPPPFLEKLCSPEDLGTKAQVLTLTLPYSCATCGTTSGQSIDVGPHHDVLKFATGPELRCASCKHAMQCVAGETHMTLLPGLPKPAAGPDLVKTIGILRERAIQTQHARKPSAKVATTSPLPVAPGRSSLLVPFLAAMLAVVIAAGGYLAYQRMNATRHASSAVLGAVTASSAEKRPAWITGDSQGTAICTDAPDKGLSCVGVSSVSARQDDAEDEAADAALDAVANALAVRITADTWKVSVIPVYKAARDAKLAAFDRDPSNTSARRDVREARNAVAQALRATSGGAVPAAPTGRYWEEYTGGDGKRYLAFAQVTLGPTEVAKLLEGYTKPVTALGATAVSMFPLVGWRFPKLEHGAIVTSLESGPLLDVGIAEQYVVLSVAGRDVTDAVSFAKLVTDEHAGLSERGGTLRLKVQASDGAPREFSTTIKGKDIAPVDTGKKPHGTANPGNHTGSGGVNIWDRFGGGKGSGRDDPTQ
jgi:anti-anti-sigma regulatory factor